MSAVKTKILTGFDDPSFNEQEWMKLLSTTKTETINMTWSWQRNWWDHFGRGKLLLILAEKNGLPIALASFFSESGMIYNICPEDALDILGDISDSEVLDAIILTAKNSVEGFLGFRIYFIPETSETGQQLQQAALRLGFICTKDDEIPSPLLDIKSAPQEAALKTRKKSLVRHENYFKREGELKIEHFSQTEIILEYLPLFFEQHINRRNATNAKSIFIDSKQREYYYDMTRNIGPSGSLRFTVIKWNDKPIAFHYGFLYKKRFLYGIPSFDYTLEKHSPGEVLLRQVLLLALDEGADSFDFGIGDEQYKYRFATSRNTLNIWGLYPETN